ncbi:MAG: NADP-dependent isocitrate dehydrogenase [Acidobacteria bacterium]|nr:NADP-dependent isocitrate dehydrogenase [Acidobacteriota bacterium]
MSNVPITVAHGDGIGPEIMAATLHILKEAVTTPQGGGFKSLNVTVRKSLGMYANIRPCVSYAPFVETRFPVMDVVIVRENEEDTYGGIEHRQTDMVEQCLKLISRPGCEKIVRYAFEYAEKNNRKKVTCFVKDNIMKQTDGLFHRIFDEIAPDYPEIENESWIVDIGAAKLATAPELFDVVVMPNLYGDILSDVTAQMTGSVGLAGSANIGENVSMFEAIHGSAPKRAGQNKANPSGLFLGAVMMLIHINQPDIATLAHNAWLRTIEDGVHTYDIAREGTTKQTVGTKEFAEEVCKRIGQKPETIKTVDYKVIEESGDAAATKPLYTIREPQKKELVGIDVFINWWNGKFFGAGEEIGALVEKINGDGVNLVMISNRGTKVYPSGQPDTFCVDHWRCRFMSDAQDGTLTKQQVINLLKRFDENGLDFIKTEHLYNFDGKAGYALGQGQ